MQGKRLIYSLCCPFTNDIHYIGKSTQGMIRPLAHLSNSHSSKVNEWVNNLKEIGHSPLVNILEYVSVHDDIDTRERYWIQYEINKNSLLLNSCLITPLLIESKLDVLLGNGQGLEGFIIGKFVKEKRKILKLTQEEFAGKAGVALTVVRKLEQGKINLNVQQVLIILRMFGCTLGVTKINK